ncbi:uncharacterized protein LOC131023124 [Salvia miltiorrhiza]|uniref:uncharacterized protein LOC131023124 n=1 Tax=Salvia miltiorrhiza TaxID=226208 RepID=UPI0025ACCA39|nr:uncharacterized protein LOC131023124 [Salvia miltiorrhiza]
MEGKIESLEAQIGQIRQQQTELGQSLMAVFKKQFEELRKELRTEGKRAEAKEMEMIHHLLNLERNTIKVINLDSGLGSVKSTSCLIPMSDTDKILTAAMHIEGQADVWYLEYVEGKDDLTWEGFKELVLDRFSNIEEKNLVAQFNKLKQETDVLSYTLKFEALKAFTVSNNRGLSEEYFVQSYISGLKDEIARMIEMFNLTTYKSAVQLAKKQELLIGSLGRGSKHFSKIGGNSFDSGWKKSHEEVGGK